MSKTDRDNAGRTTARRRTFRRRRPGRASVRTQLLAVFVVATGLMASIVVVNVKNEYDQARKAAVREVLHEARTQAHDLAFNFTQQLAPAMAAFAGQPQFRNAHPGHCAAAVRSVSALIPGGGVALVTRTGEPICTAGGYQPAQHTRWFTRALTSGVGFGGPVISPRTNRTQVGFAYALRIATGPAVLVVEMDSTGAMLSSQTNRLQLFVVSPTTGRIMDAQPRSAVTTKAAPHRLLTLPSGRAVTTDGPDGTAGIYAAAPVGDTGWLLVAGVSRSRAFAVASDSLRRNLVLGGLMVVVLLGLGFVVYRRIARPTRRLRRAIDDLATSNALDGVGLDVPDNAPRELADLGHALNDMIDARRQTEARLASLVRHASDLVFIVDACGAVTYATPSVESLLGFTGRSVIGRDFLGLVATPDQETLRHRLHSDDRGAAVRSPRFEFTLVANGIARDVEARTQRLVDDPAVAGTVVTCHDITDRKRAERELAHAAMHDALTGLPNRALALDRLSHLLARTGRSGSLSAVLFVDLDRFKLVNDSNGHGAGDELLVQVANRLRALTRPGDTLSRFGGDEFVLLCETLQSIDDAVQIADRVLEGMQAPFRVLGQETFVTASIGIAIAEPGDDPGDLLRDADSAMYRAKDGGRAGWALFDDGMRAQVQRRLDVSNKLRRALTEPGLFLEFQPVIALGAGSAAVGVEALLRWVDDDGLVRPDEFIPIAEETGLIVPIGEWVMTEACRQLMTWQADPAFPPDARVSVNVSARQLGQPDFADVVARALATSGLDPRLLVLEVTESVLMLDREAGAATLAALRALGVAVSIDDFGTGYSSLGYLERLPIDELKIDRSFVAALGRAGRTTPILDSIVGLAHAVGLTVVAEGVETEEQLGLLTRMGCDLAQGFHFARPMRADAARAYLLQHSPARAVATPA